MTFDDAIVIVEQGSGRHFDPEVVTVFKEIVADLYATVVQARDAELRQEMREVLPRYFKTEAAPEGAAR